MRHVEEVKERSAIALDIIVTYPNLQMDRTTELKQRIDEALEEASGYGCDEGEECEEFWLSIPRMYKELTALVEAERKAAVEEFAKRIIDFLRPHAKKEPFLKDLTRIVGLEMGLIYKDIFQEYPPQQSL